MTLQSHRTGQIVKKAELQKVIGAQFSLESEAQRIIKRAEEAAEQVQVLVKDGHQALNNFLRNISDEELKKFIDVETIERSAAGFVDILDTTAAMTREFEAMTPWLQRLVETTLCRIIGTLDEADLVSRVVAEAVAEVDPGEHLRIRAGVAAFPKLSRARHEFSGRFSGVVNIHRDEALEPDALFMECSCGLTDLTLQTQIDAVLSVLCEVDPLRETPS